MVLYLTGSSDSYLKKGSINSQNNPSKSLGGYVSTTPVPNGDLNAVFGIISNMTLRENRPETIGLGLINATNIDVVDVRMKIVTKADNMAQFEVAVVDISDEGAMEKIPNRYSQPQIADFYNVDFYPASINCKIVTPATPGNEFYIQPFNILVDEIDDFSVEATMNAIEDVMQFNKDYVFRKLSNDTFEISRKDEEKPQPVKPQVITDGSLVIDFDGMFESKVDNTQIISESIPSGKGIGLWIKRTIKSEYARPKTDKQLYEDYSEGKVLEDTERIKIIIEYT